MIFIEVRSASSFNENKNPSKILLNRSDFENSTKQIFRTNAEEYLHELLVLGGDRYWRASMAKKTHTLKTLILCQIRQQKQYLIYFNITFFLPPCLLTAAFRNCHSQSYFFFKLFYRYNWYLHKSIEHVENHNLTLYLHIYIYLKIIWRKMDQNVKSKAQPHRNILLVFPHRDTRGHCGLLLHCPLPVAVVRGVQAVTWNHTSRSFWTTGSADCELTNTTDKATLDKSRRQVENWRERSGKEGGGGKRQIEGFFFFCLTDAFIQVLTFPITVLHISECF